MFTTDPVRCLPKKLIGISTVMKLTAILERHTIDDDMRVDTVSVRVRGYYHLESITPQFFCQLHSDGVCFIRCDLARLEALISMIRYIASCLAEAELGRVKLVAGIFHAAVDACRVVQFLGLVLVRRMFVKTTLRFSANRLRQTV